MPKGDYLVFFGFGSGVASVAVIAIGFPSIHSLCLESEPFVILKSTRPKQSPLTETVKVAPGETWSAEVARSNDAAKLGLERHDRLLIKLKQMIRMDLARCFILLL